MECVALWKMLVDKMDELLADVALDRLAKRGLNQITCLCLFDFF